ncbi:hypothetical protein PV368_10440 [Streptomyces sp. ME02-6979A]|uniref:hypothetical protein n=1 Tax=Streptomyces sp. 111WW2 TaxID=1945515 RepID=UPI0019CD3D00|nr:MULTISPECIES: hypothetical protein [Streptomyces]MDX3345848.1 hypothetical protein [Streptomyces sp. ME02-6979A]WTC09296.1 hypothetical protein OHA15_16375 [Streptomyces anthocyanicus]WTC50562.1 hypothetical protein OG855_23665 [Streptomyces anthocyanicus]GHA49931.1 hypothetical protein GCM10010391_38310 [Streptomyces anthocyanicus]
MFQQMSPRGDDDQAPHHADSSEERRGTGPQGAFARRLGVLDLPQMLQSDQTGAYEGQSDHHVSGREAAVRDSAPSAGRQDESPNPGRQGREGGERQQGR